MCITARHGTSRPTTTNERASGERGESARDRDPFDSVRSFVRRRRRTSSSNVARRRRLDLNLVGWFVGSFVGSFVERARGGSGDGGVREGCVCVCVEGFGASWIDRGAVVEKRGGDDADGVVDEGDAARRGGRDGGETKGR